MLTPRGRYHLLPPLLPPSRELAWNLEGNFLFNELSRTQLFAHTIADLCGGELIAKAHHFIHRLSA
jgi:hypothetical protein